MKPISALLLASFLALLAGCGLSTMAMKTTISGGKEMNFMLGANGPERAKDDRASVRLSTITPSKDLKHVVFAFMVDKLASAPGIKSVKVENVSDEVPEVLLVDEAPKLTGPGVWTGSSTDREPSDPHLVWLNHEGNTARVYRLTILWEDGKTSELLQLDVVPAFLKEMVRKQLDIK